VQCSDQSIINSFDFAKDKFVYITVGISDIKHDLIISLVQKMFGLPVFVLDSMLSRHGKETLIKNKIPIKISRRNYLSSRFVIINLLDMSNCLGRDWIYWVH